MKCCEMGFEVGQTSFEKDIVINFGEDNGMCCSTGDNFVTDTSYWILS